MLAANRFARNVAGAIDDVQRIQALGGHLAFVEEDIDPTGPFGSFILTVLLAVAKEIRRANDTYAFGLAAQPGQSQGRPAMSTGSQPKEQIAACPLCVLPRKPQRPIPSDAKHATGQTTTTLAPTILIPVCQAKHENCEEVFSVDDRQCKHC